MDDGSPTLLDAPTPSAAPGLMTADAPGVAGQDAASYQWGIYKDGNPLVIADSVLNVDYRHEWHISDYPQEEGAFQSYNKVQVPFEARVILTKGGTVADRLAFLADIEAAGNSTDLYDVWTPERTYVNTSIVRVDYRRTARAGAGLISVEIWLAQIRMSASAAYSVAPQSAGNGRGFITPLGDTRTQSGSDSVSNGVVQTVTATPAQVKMTNNPTAGGR